MAFKPRRSARPAGMGKPQSPGKSATAPGQRMKALGLPNASTIAPGRVRVSTPPPVTKPPVRSRYRT